MIGNEAMGLLRPNQTRKLKAMERFNKPLSLMLGCCLVAACLLAACKDEIAERCVARAQESLAGAYGQAAECTIQNLERDSKSGSNPSNDMTVIRGKLSCKASNGKVTEMVCSGIKYANGTYKWFYLINIFYPYPKTVFITIQGSIERHRHIVTNSTTSIRLSLFSNFATND